MQDFSLPHQNCLTIWHWSSGSLRSPFSFSRSDNRLPCPAASRSNCIARERRDTRELSEVVRKRMGKEVAESCIDGLLIEMVSSYCNNLYANTPELAARRIEAIGYQVGHQLSERYTMERPRFNDHLEAIKFICKDFWSEVFKKQIDNLKTNHKGTFVLQDNRFRFLSRMSIEPSPEATDQSQDGESKVAQTTSMHLYFPCGIIRGALSNLGIPCAVSADISNLPACSFVVRIKI